MRPVSDAFLRTLTGSHSMVARARVCSTFQTGVDPTGVEIPIMGGDVQMSGAADVWASLNLETDGTGMWPEHADDELAPYGNEVYVERGIAYSDIEIEWVGLGYFRIQTPEQDAGHDGPITIEAFDRMRGIIDGRLVSPRQFLAGATNEFIFETLVHRIYPDATVEFEDAAVGAAQLARSVVAGLDDESQPFPFLDRIVRSYGQIWHWDHRGVLVIRPMPDPTDPVWKVRAGRGGVLVAPGLSRRLTRDGVYNAVVASGEGGDTLEPVRAVVVDADANSPTYYYGRFGRVPRYLTSSFIATKAQAVAAAQSELRKYLGLPKDVSFSSVPNPALEPYDAVQLLGDVREAYRIHVIDTLTIPLTPSSAMPAQTRQQTVTLPGSASE